MSMELKITFDESQLAKLMKIPVLMRLGPAERILKAMAKPIVVRAKAIAPNSRTSGTRDKMSSETKAKWPESGKNHIKMIYRKGDGGGYLVIGASDPLGNSLNFDSSSRGRKVFYWGKDSGKIKRVEPSQRFMQKAFDETKSAQISAGNAQLEKEMKELNLG
jgi:hypothetical protein